MASKLTIFKVTGGYIPAEKQGGTAVVAHDLVKALQLQGHEVKVFTTNANGDGYLPFENVWKSIEGVDVFFASKIKSFFPYKSPSLIKELEKQICACDVVLLAAVWVWYGPIVAKLAKKYHKPVYLYTHGVRSTARMRTQGVLKKLAWWHLYDKKMFNSVNGIIAITEDEKLELSKLTTQNNIVVVPNGVREQTVETNPRKVLSSSYSFSNDTKFIYFLGRTEPTKGCDLLIKSFSQISIGKGNDWRLVIAGPDRNNHRSELEQLCRDYAIEDKVVFAGPVSGAVKAALFQECSGFALLSVTEVLAMSALEAMQYAKPVIVTDVNAFAAFIEKGVIYSAARDENAISNVLMKMLSGDTEASLIGRRGREEVQNNYTWSSIADQTLEVLSTLELGKKL